MKRSTWLQILGAIVAGVSLLFVVWAVTQPDEGNTSYQLQVQTMLPQQLSVRPDEVSCPNGASESPIDYDERTALADVLRLYDGDLISIRFTLDSVGSPMPDTVILESEWPQNVVGDAGPSCVFIVGANGGASATWERLESGAARFEFTGLSTAGPTTLEVWLVADNPQDGATFNSIVTPEDVTNADVIDPLGGRLRVVRRSSSTPLVNLAATPVDVQSEGQSVVATVTNPSPTTRAFDVQLELAASGPVAWQLADDTAENLACTVVAAVQCRLGDLASGDVVTVTAVMTPTDELEPRAVTCDGPPAESGFGVCIEASATVGSDDSLESSASSLIDVDRPTDQALLVAVEPDPVIATSDGLVDVTFSVSSNLDSDLGTVRIVGSDCSSVERIEQVLDDNDVFLQPGETWKFACRLALPDAGIFRFDVAAIDESGEDVGATYEDFAMVVDPGLDVTSGIDGSRARFEVTNTGRGDLFDVAIRVPGCDSIRLTAGDADVLQEGDSVVFECDAERVQTSAAVAYATVSGGSRVVSSG